MTSSQELSRFDIDNREILWQGVVKTDFIQFEASAKFAAGADPSNVKELTFTWSSLLPDTILIHGRIRKDVADEYLKSFQWSSKDIIIMTVEPDKNGQPGFDELFEYFSVRQRYGVGSNHYNKAIKDIYVIPIKKQKTAAKEAAFLSLLDNDYLHQAATTDMFLLVFTATIRELGQNAATGSARIRRPITRMQLTQF